MSKHPEDNIDQVLRDKLDGFQPELRPEVWEGISAGVQSGRGRRGAWMWWVGAAVLLLGIGAGLVTWFGSTGTEQAPELADSISDVTVNTPLENELIAQNNTPEQSVEPQAEAAPVESVTTPTENASIAEESTDSSVPAENRSSINPVADRPTTPSTSTSSTPTSTDDIDSDVADTEVRNGSSGPQMPVLIDDSAEEPTNDTPEIADESGTDDSRIADADIPTDPSADEAEVPEVADAGTEAATTNTEKPEISAKDSAAPGNVSTTDEPALDTDKNPVVSAEEPANEQTATETPSAEEPTTDSPDHTDETADAGQGSAPPAVLEETTAPNALPEQPDRSEPITHPEVCDRKLSIEVQGGSNISYRTLESDVHHELVNHKNDNEGAVNTFSYGISANYFFWNNPKYPAVGIRAGYFHSIYGENYEFANQVASHSTINTYRYHSVSLQLRTRLICTGKIQAGLSGGILYNRLSLAESSWLDPSTFDPVLHSNDGDKHPFNQEVISYTLEAYGQYNLNDRFFLMGSVMGEQFSRSVYKTDVQLEQRPYAIRLHGGFGIRF